MLPYAHPAVIVVASLAHVAHEHLAGVRLGQVAVLVMTCMIYMVCV